MFSKKLDPYLPLEHGCGKFIAMLLMPIVIIISTVFLWTKDGFVAGALGTFELVCYGMFLLIVWGQHGTNPIAFVKAYWNRNVIGYAARMYVCDDKSVQMEIWTAVRRPERVAVFSSASSHRACRTIDCYALRLPLGGRRKSFGGFFPCDQALGTITEEQFVSGTVWVGTTYDWKFRVARKRGRALLQIIDPGGLSREYAIDHAVVEFTDLISSPGRILIDWGSVDIHHNFNAQWHHNNYPKVKNHVDELIGVIQEFDGTSRLVTSKDGRSVRWRIWEALSRLSDDPRIESLRECPVRPARVRRKQAVSSEPIAAS